MPRSASDLSRGFTAEVVNVMDVVGNVAEVANLSIGKRRQIRMDIQRTGIRPAVGQTWIIDRSLGYWTFAAILQGSDPSDPGRLYGLGGTFYG